MKPYCKVLQMFINGHHDFQGAGGRGRFCEGDCGVCGIICRGVLSREDRRRRSQRDAHDLLNARDACSSSNSAINHSVFKWLCHDATNQRAATQAVRLLLVVNAPGFLMNMNKYLVVEAFSWIINLSSYSLGHTTASGTRPIFPSRRAKISCRQ